MPIAASPPAFIFAVTYFAAADTLILIYFRLLLIMIDYAFAFLSFSATLLRRLIFRLIADFPSC